MTATEIVLPYGRDHITIHVPSDKLVDTYMPRALPPVKDPVTALRNALQQPIDKAPLCEVAAGVERVAIAIEDATRPVPNALLIDAVMSELQTPGIEPSQVTIIVATGLHRGMNSHEIGLALGSWHGQLAVENHDARDTKRLVRVGTTSLGTEISVNRSFMEADLRITTGDVEYHQFCGYGGGVKCVYPGLADAQAIRTNHARMDLPGTGPGRIDGNPVRAEIDEVGRMVDVGFNVSVALDAQHRIVGACTGDPDASFRQACQFVDRMYRVSVAQRADLVIASPGGFPKDLDLYQSQKAIETATQLVTPGGAVLITASCDEGSGSLQFEQWMDQAYSPDDIIRRIKDNFVMGGHKAYQIAREVARARVYLYSKIAPGRVRAFLMLPVQSVEDMAPLIARAKSVIVLPQATLIHAGVSSEQERLINES